MILQRRYDLLLAKEIILVFQSHTNIALQSQGTSSPNISSDKWIINSGVTNHMSHHLPSFVSLSTDSSMSIATANNDSVPLSGIGTMATPSLSLSDVYCVPGLAMNLAFVRNIYDSGYNVCFYPSVYFVQDRTSQKVIEIGRRLGGLYVLNQFRESIVPASSIDLSLFRLSFSSPFYL